MQTERHQYECLNFWVPLLDGGLFLTKLVVTSILWHLEACPDTTVISFPNRQKRAQVSEPQVVTRDPGVLCPPGASRLTTTASNCSCGRVQPSMGLCLVNATVMTECAH